MREKVLVQTFIFIIKPLSFFNFWDYLDIFRLISFPQINFPLIKDENRWFLKIHCAQSVFICTLPSGQSFRELDTYDHGHLLYFYFLDKFLTTETASADSDARVSSGIVDKQVLGKNKVRIWVLNPTLNSIPHIMKHQSRMKSVRKGGIICMDSWCHRPCDKKEKICKKDGCEIIRNPVAPFFVMKKIMVKEGTSSTELQIGNEVNLSWNLNIIGFSLFSHPHSYCSYSSLKRGYLSFLNIWLISWLKVV